VPLIQELRRRNVIRMAGLYLVGAWLVVQVAGTVLPMFGAPAWLPRTIVLLLMIGFVPALVFAWVFELTPEGLKRDEEVKPGESIATQTARRMEHMIVVVLLLAVGYFCVDKFVLAPKRQAAAVASERNARGSSAASGPSTAARVAPANAKSIAVLPFENLSEDKANGYFADGIQDQILTGLAKIGDLKVISRTSTQKYASRPENLSQIARELGVAHILEGSVQRAGNKVRINVQLIEAATDNHLWAEIYDRTLDDVFQVETEVAQKIAESLAANLSRGELAALSAKPTDVPAAYDAYLRARVLNARVVQTRQQADRMLDAYREAVRLDPKFTLAWAELARECFRIGWVGLDPSGALLREGEEALRKATELSPQSPQVEEARAVHMYYVQRDFPAALAIIQSLKAKLPNDADIWMWGGYLGRRVGKWQQSLADFEHARVLSPNDANITYHLAVTAVSSGDCARGLRDLDASLALSGDNTHALAMKLQCAWSANDLPRAAAYLATADGKDPAVQGLLGTQLLYERKYAAAAAQLQRAIDGANDTLVDAFLNGYVPARLDWTLQLALAQQRLGLDGEATANYRQAKAEATRALATTSHGPYIEAAWRAVLGQALAGLGERAAAAEQARRVGLLAPESVDALEGPGWTYYKARILALNGDAAQATPVLRHLVRMRSSLMSVENLRIDPAFDAIREAPEFKALLAEAPVPGHKAAP
jgi:TolB-like protein/cytochrome c-type biogenesis protein CcmH/NrfG